MAKTRTDTPPEPKHILAYHPRDNTVYIIDPTVRWETNDDLDAKVQKDKQDIYESCFDDLAQRYPAIQGREREVIGLWFGARGTVSTRLVQFFDRFKLERKKLVEISESVLAESIRMIHFHIYS